MHGLVVRTNMKNVLKVSEKFDQHQCIAECFDGQTRVFDGCITHG